MSSSKADSGDSDMFTFAWDRVLQPFDEAIGEWTGRNRAREEQYKNEDRLKVEQTKADQAQANEQLQRYQEDLAASRSAQAIRSTASSRTSAVGSAVGTPVSGGQRLGSDERDVLGV